MGARARADRAYRDWKAAIDDLWGDKYEALLVEQAAPPARKRLPPANGSSTNTPLVLASRRPPARMLLAQLNVFFTSAHRLLDIDATHLVIGVY